MVRFNRSLHITCILLMSCLVALADNVPSGKQSASPFTGTHAGQTRNDNGLKTVFIWIPPGSFAMGSPKDEPGRNFQETQVEATLTTGFWLGQNEVTQSEWRRVMRTSPWDRLPFVRSGDEYPATYVSWDGAMEFCKKLTQSERAAGRMNADWSYSLPTEAQWEFACRAGTTTPFAFGDDDSLLEDYAWWGGLFSDRRGKIASYAHEVGRKNPNPWGLCDMHGNCWEWCRDWLAKDMQGGIDPEGPANGSVRVFRGGGWCDRAASCRSASRSWNLPDTQTYLLGFRVAAVWSGKQSK